MANKMERFTQRARRVLSLAQEEAERMQHAYIGTEHLLLALMREKESVAYKVLRQLEMEHFQVSDLVKKLNSSQVEDAILDLSPDLKSTLEAAVAEARDRGHPYIGTEHLLLGLMRQTEGVAVEIFKRMSVSPDMVRERTLRMLEENPVQGAQFAVKAKQEYREYIEADILMILRLRLQSHLLSSLLAKLTEPDAADELSSLLDTTLSEQSITVNEQIRMQFLNSLKELMKSDADKRRMRVYITDKATGGVIVDMRIQPLEVHNLIRNYGEYIASLKREKKVVLDDDRWRIELSIDDEQQAGAGTA